MKININLGKLSYDILVENGALKRLDEELDLKRKALIVTDSGVPREYAQTVAAFCESPFIMTIGQGEGSKSIEVWEKLLQKMLYEGFTRFDAVVAVGGGVVGDISGFAAASYMRGIDFYNIPTTLLSQVDSSVGGKTAVNLDGIKNIVGAFYQPKKVIIDPEVLKTLDNRQFSSGLAEAIKMAACFDEELFELIESGNAVSNIERIIEKSIGIKASVVEKDEKEAGLRKALNFGHTFGHGIEANSTLYHGECVALGMLEMCSDEVKERLINVYKKYSLPTSADVPREKIIDAARHDKKTVGNKIDAVFVEKIGSFEFRKIEL